MAQEITIIALGGLMGMGANCYLINTKAGFILIDTGYTPKRGVLLKALDEAGCKPGNLQLIVITHAHGDHTGRAAYLQGKYATKIGLHPGDAKMAAGESPAKGAFEKAFTRIMAIIFGTGKSAPFKPGLFIEDGFDFAKYGFDAKAIHTPGHSPGSISILTKSGDLFCGDLIMNTSNPRRSFIIVDEEQFDASIAKLKALPVKMVYPGHGKPFLMTAFIENS